MADSLNIIVGSKIDQSSQAVKNIEEQIKQMSGKIKEAISVKLQIDAKQLEVVTKEIEKAQEKIRTKTLVKGSVFINPEVENQAFNQISSRIRDIRKNVDELAKVDITTNKSGQMTSATLTYYNKELGKTVTETMGWSEAQKKVNGELIKTKTFETQGFKYSDNMAKAKQETEKYAQSLKDLELYKQKMLGGNGFLGDIDIFASKQKGRYSESALAKIRTDIEALTINTPDLNNKMKQLGIQFSSLNKNASEAGGVLARAAENAGKFLRFYLVGGMLVGFVNSIRKGIESVVELDASLTELNKVADLSNTQLQSFTKTAYNAGTELARTGKEVINATTTFKRAGYELQDAFNLSKEALLLTNIGDGITNVTEASSSLIAILKGFKLEAESTSHIVDALNEVSNNYAIDTNNLTEILKRTSGTLGQTGTSYEQLLGLATGGFESLRNAEMVASGINMISQRLRGMTEDGEKVEGLIPKIQEAFDKYTDGAVSIIDKQNGGLHSTFEILQSLSKVYPQLSDEARAYLNEAVAGNRQNKVLVAIMDNWKNVESATLSATNSLGSANKENEKYLNSINGKISQLSSNLQLFWQNTIDSDIIKGIVDTLTGLVKILDTLVNNSFSSFIIQVGLTTVAISLLGKGLNALKMSSLGTAVGVLALDIAEKGLLTTTKTLTAAMLASPLFWTTAVVAGIYAAVKAVDYFTVSIEEQREKVETLSSELQNLQSEYDKLASKDTKTEQELKYLDVLQAQINAQKTLLADETKRLVNREYLTGDASGDINSAIKQSTYGLGKTGDINKAIADIKKYNDELTNLDGSSKNFIKRRTEINTKIADSTNFLGEEYTIIKSRIKALEEVNAQGSEEYNVLIANAKAIEEVILQENKLAEAKNNTSNATQNETKSVEEWVNVLSKTKEEMSSLNSALEEYKENGKFSSDTLLDLISKYPDLIKYLNDEKQLYEEISKKIQNKTTDLQNSLNTELTALETSINEKAKGYVNDLKNWKTVEEAKDKITTDMLNRVKEKYNEVLNFTGDEDTAYLSAKKFAGRLKQSLDSALPDISKYIDLKSLNVGKLTSGSSGKSSKSGSSSKQTSLSDILKKEQEYQNKVIDAENKSKNLLNEEYEARLKNLDIEKKANEELLKYYESQRANAKAKGLESELQEKALKVQGDLANIEKTRKDINKDLLESQKKQTEEAKKQKEEQQKNLEDVQKSLVDIIKKRYELERDKAKETHDKNIEYLEDELDEYKDSIQEKMNALDKFYDKQKFENKQNESTNKISELMSERNTLSMAAQSGDLTAIERIKEIDKELAEERSSLAELQSDREHDLRKQNLQDMLDSKEKEIKDAKDAEDAKYEKIKANYDNLLEQGNLFAAANKALTTGMVEDINGKLVTIEDAFKTFNDRFGETLGTLGSNIQTEFIDKLNQAQALINNMSGLPTNKTSLSSTNNLSKTVTSNSTLPSFNLSSLLSKFDISKIMPTFNIPQVSAVGGKAMGDFNINVPVNVAGSADKMTALEIGNTVAKIIKQELNKSGVFRK